MCIFFLFMQCLLLSSNNKIYTKTSKVPKKKPKKKKEAWLEKPNRMLEQRLSLDNKLEIDMFSWAAALACTEACEFIRLPMIYFILMKIKNK